MLGSIVLVLRYVYGQLAIGVTTLINVYTWVGRKTVKQGESQNGSNSLPLIVLLIPITRINQSIGLRDRSFLPIGMIQVGN